MPLTYEAFRRVGIVEQEPHRFVGEVSGLSHTVPEFATGFPARVATTIGNGQPFIRTKVERDREGDLQSVTYTQQLGCVTLLLFND